MCVCVCVSVCARVCACECVLVSELSVCLCCSDGVVFLAVLGDEGQG